jgi:prepilin-type N-terminal cleavage/methylation domain-containing protein
MGNNRRHRGFTLIESLVVLALLSMLTLVALPALHRSTGKIRLSLAAQEVVGAMRTARFAAIRKSANVAVRFGTAADGVTSFALYADGDGDGVLNRDIASGVDPMLGPARRQTSLGRGVRIGFPPGPMPRDPANPRRRLTAGDAVRFNQSDLASFSALGGATPGSVYLTDGRRGLVVVRVLNRTGRVRVLHYDPDRQSWGSSGGLD